MVEVRRMGWISVTLKWKMRGSGSSSCISGSVLQKHSGIYRDAGSRKQAVLTVSTQANLIKDA
jgi:hypothetical protein